jgi:CHAD domain-containing protein
MLPSLARRDWKRLRRGVGKLPSAPADPELHRIRILAKRLRYAADAASDVVGKPATRLAKAATNLQDILGDHQDSVTARAWLRESSALGPRAFVAGELSMLENQAAGEDRAAFPGVWKKVQRKRLRKWMI